MFHDALVSFAERRYIFMKSKNYEIEMYRFMMCMVILVFHCCEDYFGGGIGLFPRGFLAVEFFFILSGCLVYRHFLNAQSEQNEFNLAIEYLCSRFKRLVIPLIIVSAIMLGCILIDNHWDFLYTLRYLWKIKWQFVFLHHVGAPFGYVERSVWYLSPLLIVSWILYCCLLLNEKKTIHFLDLLMGGCY